MPNLSEQIPKGWTLIRLLHRASAGDYLATLHVSEQGDPRIYGQGVEATGATPDIALAGAIAEAETLIAEAAADGQSL